MGQSIHNVSWLAASLGTVSLVLTLVVFPMAYQAIRLLEAEIESEKVDFMVKSNHLWKQIMEQRPHSTLVSKRQVVEIIATCPNGGKPLTLDSGRAVRCENQRCPTGYRCTGPGPRICCPVVLRDDFSSLPEFCNCNPQNSCPDGAPGPPGTDGTPGTPGEPGSNGEPGLSGEDVAQETSGCGEACPPGPPGQPGVDGPPGPKGAPGGAGPKGNPGGNGGPGNKGNNGLPGAPGQSGRPGSPGSPGPDGSRGSPGPAGPKGPNGGPGEAGDPGPNGPDGQSGQPGRPGPSGSPGTPGSNGEPGGPGGPGEDGDSGNDAQYCGCPGRTNRARNLLGLGASRIIRVRNQ